MKGCLTSDSFYRTRTSSSLSRFLVCGGEDGVVASPLFNPPAKYEYFKQAANINEYLLNGSTSAAVFYVPQKIYDYYEQDEQTGAQNVSCTCPHVLNL